MKATMDDFERRISTLEGERPLITDIKASIADIKKFVLEDMNARNAQHTLVSSTLAVIVEQNKRQEVYQIKCEDDRKRIDTEKGESDRRLDALEGFQSRLLRNAIGASTIAAFVINQAVEWVKK